MNIFKWLNDKIDELSICICYKTCKHYQANNPHCQNDFEASRLCGIRRYFDCVDKIMFKSVPKAKPTKKNGKRRIN